MTRSVTLVRLVHSPSKPMVSVPSSTLTSTYSIMLSSVSTTAGPEPVVRVTLAPLLTSRAVKGATAISRVMSLPLPLQRLPGHAAWALSDEPTRAARSRMAVMNRVFMVLVFF